MCLYNYVYVHVCIAVCIYICFIYIYIFIYKYIHVCSTCAYRCICTRFNWYWGNDTDLAHRVWLQILAALIQPAWALASQEPADYTLFFQADAADHLHWGYLSLDTWQPGTVQRWWFFRVTSLGKFQSWEKTYEDGMSMNLPGEPINHSLRTLFHWTSCETG